MKNIREIALTPYYPYGKNKERIIVERVLTVDRSLEEHDVAVRADERAKVLDEVLDAFKNEWTLDSLACHEDKYGILEIIKRQIEQLKET